MVFQKDEKLTNFLKDVFEKEEKITIEGVNGYGVKFKTSGIIAADDHGHPGIYEDDLMIQFKFNKNGLGIDPEDRILAPFHTQRNQVYFMDPSLYIFTIYDSKGNKIYENPNKTQILEEIKTFSAEHKKRKKLERRDLVEFDDVTKELFKYIGKPIILVEKQQCYTGVLSDINGANNAGETMINIRVATLCGGISVGPDTTLFTIDDKNNIRIVADNSLNAKNKGIMKRRVDRIFEDVENE